MTAAPLASVRSWPFPARLFVLLAGLFLYGFAIRLQIDASVGLAPWDIFHQGLSRKTGLTFGTVSVLVGVLLVGVAWFWLGMKPGVGSVLNMLLIGFFIDLLAGHVPTPNLLWLQWAQFAFGVVLLGLATGTYVAASMGAGPRDSTVLGLSSKYSVPVGRVRTAIEAIVLLSGWALGGHLGLGTLAFALGIGPAMSFGLKLYGLERRK
ncbi:YczE/YyaS/YitT family protein [Deinococcus yavapaiensis]|uniref:YczE/YyaS/YitT family protein n=1 Tax=Deinococcus yavapaiensis TaxID=309889 RepID=UPI001FE2EA26|nr:YitT family protein [Deinococcus yavapaiensis]